MDADLNRSNEDIQMEYSRIEDRLAQALENFKDRTQKIEGVRFLNPFLKENLDQIMLDHWGKKAPATE